MRLLDGFFLALGALALCGCGYVGDPLPPSLHIPEPIETLAATQTARGIEIAAALPALTTDGLKIRELQDAEVRVGAYRGSLEAWLEASERVSLAKEPLLPGAELRLTVPAQPWEGQEIAVAVRTYGQSGRPSAWSELHRLQVVRALPAPAAVRAELGASGVRLAWPAVAGAENYRIYRHEGQEPARPALDQAGTDVQTPEWTDTAVTPGATYSYFVQARAGDRASPWSQPTTVKVEDTFPPPVPTGLTAVPALSSIELSWEAVASADIGGYRVYRSLGDGGEWRVVADAVAVPAYSDGSLESGRTYRYAVASVDRSGNESGRSEAVTAQAP